MRAFAITLGLAWAITLAGCWSHAHMDAHAAVAPDFDLARDDHARITDAIHRAGVKLRSLARPDGRFVYEYRVADGRETGDYNIVRHAGAIYALVMFAHAVPDPATDAVIAATSRYLIAHAVRPVPAEPALRAVFDMNEPGVIGTEAVLGATGLGVVALVAADQLAPGTIDAQTVRELGNFILYMQRADGSFFSLYTVDGGRNSERDSLYYPGEAILALAMLDAWQPDPRWHDAAVRGLRFLATSRADSTDVPSDNWALTATAELVRQGTLADADRPLVLHHADQVATVNVADQIGDRGSAIFGCYGDDGRTTPSSTHLEGLLADAALSTRADVRASIDAGIHFLLESQLADGAMPGDQRRRDVRIDYIQHALSAFIRYRDLPAAGASRETRSR